MVASKDMTPFPKTFGKIFWNNQFKVVIDLPTRSKYPDLANKVAIITGANSGLGFEAAKQFINLGLPHLILAVRSLSRGNEAASTLRAGNARVAISVWELDMESYDSIQAFVRKCNAEFQCIDFKSKETGREIAIQVNHISTALLTVLLLPILKAKSSPDTPARLTVVNSITSHLCKFPNRDHRPLLPCFDDTSIVPWNAQERYGVSKLLSQLFLVKLSEQVNRNHVVINMVEPGLTKGTGLMRDMKGLMLVAGKAFLGIAGRPVERGAATYLDAVMGQGVESHGCFVMNINIAPLSTFYYSDAGKVAQEQIWRETMEELRFADLEDVIASMK